MNRTGLLKRNRNIKTITLLFYEKGRQDRNYKWIWTHYIYPLYGINYQTYTGIVKSCTEDTTEVLLGLIEKILKQYLTKNGKL